MKAQNEPSTIKSENGSVQNRGNWMCTYSNIRFYPLDPRPEEINIKDIAHSLSMMCRFAGHVNHFYSVAEHCVRGSFQVPKQHALEFLLHDAPEAYCVDIPRPLKYAPEMSAYLDIEESISNAVSMRFGLPIGNHPCIKEADNRMLVTEQRDLRSSPALLKDMCAKYGIQPYDFHINPWAPYVAEQNYLTRFYQLYKGD